MTNFRSSLPFADSVCLGHRRQSRSRACHGKSWLGRAVASRFRPRRRSNSSSRPTWRKLPKSRCRGLERFANAIFAATGVHRLSAQSIAAFQLIPTPSGPRSRVRSSLAALAQDAGRPCRVKATDVMEVHNELDAHAE